MMMLETYLRRWQRLRRRIVEDKKIMGALHMAAALALGLCLSAASLSNLPQPIAMAVLCAGMPGWLPIPFALGGAIGYWGFWGQAGSQGVIWMAAALPVCVLAGWEKTLRRIPLLQPVMAAMPRSMTIARRSATILVFMRCFLSFLCAFLCYKPIIGLLTLSAI